MSFVIDSLEWDFNGKDAVAVSNLLEQILDRISIAKERNELIYIGKDLQSQSVFNDMDLWAFLYSDLMIDVDGAILDELAAALNGLDSYEDDETIWPPNFPDAHVVDENQHDLGLDIAFAHHTNLSKRPMGCLTLTDESTKRTISPYGSIDIQLIIDDVSHKNFWRITALKMLRDNPTTLEELSPSMYPNLRFINNVWSGVSSFQGGYPRASHQLKKLLDRLDDHGAWAFCAPPPALTPSEIADEQHIGTSPSNSIIEQRFTGLGVEMAPEKPNVRQHGKSYRARLVNFKPNPDNNHIIPLYCEWHGKLERHTNRVHVHPPIQESDGKVIVAIFHKHLPLP